jgi:hypothetical protein
VPFPAGSVAVNFAAGKAAFEIEDLDLEDYHDFVNSLLDGPSIEASTSFKVEWKTIASRQTVRDPANHFVVDLFTTSATISWVASSGGNTFKPITQNAPLFAGLGLERNGVFF